MARRARSAMFMGLVVAGAASMGACSSDAQQQTTSDGAVSQDADFSVCQDTAAVIYMPGIKVDSTTPNPMTPGAYVATLDSAVTEGTPQIVGPEIGLNTWVVSITNAADGTKADVTMTAERPRMPLHGHGATTYPVVTPGDPGKFTISEIDFFMAGYWEQQLNLQPASGTAEKATFAICVPQ
jgi:hypothetical protein